MSIKVSTVVQSN